MLGKITLLSLVFAMFVLIAGTWCISLVGLKQSIPFGSLSIMPDGTPRLNLFEIPLGAGFQGESLKLTHTLAFDGSRYFSEIQLPALTTRVNQEDKDSYVWYDLEGRIFLLNANESLPNNRWILEIQSKDKLLIRATESDEHYTYSSGRLQEAYSHGVRQNYYYDEGNRLNRIVATKPGNQTTLRFSYDRNGRLDAINFPTERMNFMRNNDGVLTGITRDNRLAIAFTYTDGLLTGASYEGKTFNWTWGAALMGHSLPHIPPPPVLCSDGANTYKVVYDSNLIKVYWTQIESGVTKKWDYLPITNRMKVRPF